MCIGKIVSTNLGITIKSECIKGLCVI